MNLNTLQIAQQIPPSSLHLLSQKWPFKLMKVALTELLRQAKISAPLMVMNIMWFARVAITTAFLGHLGELQLVGGTLGFTFANVTGFSVLNGLCSAMEPICGQAFGAKNFSLLHKTLVMAISLLLIASLPVSFLWLNADKILLQFGQQEDVSMVAKNYLFYLLPGLVVKSFLSPLKEYLSAQSSTLPLMGSAAAGVAFHVPINILLSRTKGLHGVSMAIWISDLLVVILLASYVVIAENYKSKIWKEGGWWDQGNRDWVKMLKLCGPYCITTCLEWWCYEILVLVTGRLRDAKQAVGALAIVLNFDYLLYSVNVSLGTCASIRVSNELGANQTGHAYRSACVALALSAVLSCVGGSATLASRGGWGRLFSQDKGIIIEVKRTMLLMALIEVINFPLAVCGGIVRGTARPWLGMSTNIVGFYLLALPLGAILAFKAHLGLQGLLAGFLCGTATCLVLLLVSIAKIDWEDEGQKAQILACHTVRTFAEDEVQRDSAVAEMAELL